MTSKLDDLFPDDDDDDSREWALRVLRSRGIRAAVTAAISVCEDPKAPAPARASAAIAIIRANGLLDGKDDDASKAPHEMSAAELNTALMRLKRQARSLAETDHEQPSQPSGAKKRRRGGVFD